MTFVELMSNATPDQRTKMKIAIVSDGFSFSTANSWSNGGRTPKTYYQHQLKKHIKRIFDLDLCVAELFPTSSNR
jgi:hypothetical protein